MDCKADPVELHPIESPWIQSKHTSGKRFIRIIQVAIILFTDWRCIQLNHTQISQC